MRAFVAGFWWIAMTALPAAELPVRQVVLYKHGVGYFERQGQLGSGESARLDFKASEMNDVLKSLTIEEKGGGKVSGLRYDSSQPLDEKLAEFPFEIGDQKPLSALLDQLKGARVEMKLGGETVKAQIVSARQMAGADKRPQQEQVTLLLDSGDLRTVDLTTVASIRFTDAKLQAQFQDYLATLVSARSKDKRSVYIDSTDSKPRQIFASYVIPTPVWKSSYRLIFQAAAQPTLEGWAIVDNVTGEDWTNVQLSLVSGRSISFVSKLYEPRFVARPEAELPEERAQAPVVHEGAMVQEREAAPGGNRPGRAMAKAMPAPPPPPPMAAMRPLAGLSEELRGMAPSSIAPAAQGQELGELFEYRISSPVTVRKSESAMLPFLQQKINGRKLLVYADQGWQHPTNAAELTNSTGKTLDGGPVTVFDAGAYGGEALMETLKSGDKRLISYAVDLGTRVTTQLDSGGNTVREIHVARGVMTTRLATVETKTYTIHNVDQKAKTLIIEHPVRPDYKLIDRKPVETTAHAYRFEVKLGAGATEKFAVTEERVYDTTVSLVNQTPDTLGFYLQNKALSAAGRKQLQDIVEVKRQMASLDGESKRTQADADALVRDQERIRQNINSLNRVSGQEQQVQTYARQLADQEGKLAGLRDRMAELQRKRVALESDLNSKIEKMEF